MTAPINEFFAESDFSREALYTPPAGAVRTIRIIFDNEYAQTVLGDVIVENGHPLAYARTEDVSDATNAATLTVEETVYRVKEVQPDGQGITTLILSKRGVN